MPHLMVSYVRMCSTYCNIASFMHISVTSTLLDWHRPKQLPQIFMASWLLDYKAFQKRKASFLSFSTCGHVEKLRITTQSQQQHQSSRSLDAPSLKAWMLYLLGLFYLYFFCFLPFPLPAPFLIMSCLRGLSSRQTHCSSFPNHQ